MRNYLLTLLVGLLACTRLSASPIFDESTKYRFVCKYYGSGMLALGTNHSSSALLYYSSSLSSADDGWWYIRKGDNGGYTISNAKSGEYITYTGKRQNNVCKGLENTAAVDGTNSEWTFQENGNYLAVVNQGNSNIWFNVRVDGTGILGSYSGSSADNELFTIYDEKGNAVSGTTGGGGDSTENDFSASKGMTEEGEYWERTGLDFPVVCTDDTSDPVLYSIVNLRKTTYVYNSGYQLEQTTDPSSRTKFYFVKQGSNVQIFTQSGSYVSTSYPSYYQTYQMGLSVNSYGTTGNTWNFAWSDADAYSGYAIGKMDNLESTGGQGGFGGGYGFNQQSEYRYWNDYNGAAIGLYDVDDGSLFVFTSADSRHLDYLRENGITFDGSSVPTASTVNSALDSIRLDDKALVYDKNAKMYYYPLPDDLRQGGAFSPKFTYKLKTAYEGYSVTIDGQSPAAADSTITITDPTCERTYTVALVGADGTEVTTSKLQFSYMPLVEITATGSFNGSYYTTGTIRVTSQITEGYDSTFIAAYKYRGASAQNYAKKSFAVKLRDDAGRSVDRKLIGLRSDNNWILDAMAIDRNCMNNRVATDLWNDFSTDPYYKSKEKKARTGTRGQFVELFVNGKYHGIYCMTEKLDRKQLKLKKYVAASESTTGEEEVHGLLYKSYDWGYETFMGHNSGSKYFPLTAPESYTNTLGKETYASQFEFKYPDYEEEAVDWAPLYNAIKFVATSTQTTFDSKVKDYFDYPVLRDYYLFLDVMLATDNHGKNMFYYVYDRKGEYGDKLGLCPWDLDGTFGRNWAGSSSYTSDATQDFDDFLWENEHGQLTIYYKLNTSTAIPWDDDLKARYAELRPTAFNPDNLVNRFESYAALFEESGADGREEVRWPTYHSGIQNCVSYTTNWIRSRITALDEKYGFDPIASSVNSAVSDAYLNVSGSQGAITFTAGSPRSVSIYNAAGALVRTVSLGQGFHVERGFQPGVYVAAGRKVVVR